MPDIRIGSPVKANDHSTTVAEEDTTQITDISSTTYIAGTPTVDFTFVAPTSGRVILIVSGGFRDAGGQRSFLTPFIWTGTDTTGTVVIDGTNFNAHGVGGCTTISRYSHFSRRSLLSGLTPGATHFAQLRYSVDGGSTADIRNRGLIVKPAT